MQRLKCVPCRGVYVYVKQKFPSASVKGGQRIKNSNFPISGVLILNDKFRISGSLPDRATGFSGSLIVRTSVIISI